MEREKRQKKDTATEGHNVEWPLNFFFCVYPNFCAHEPALNTYNPVICLIWDRTTKEIRTYDPKLCSKLETL